MRQERLATAQTSGRLAESKDEDEIPDIDIVRASGLAGVQHPLGLAIWRWRYGGVQREIKEVARGLVAAGYAPELVHRVLCHLEHDRCEVCKGRGALPVQGTPHLEEVPCPACHGAGRRQLDGVDERRLLDHMSGLEREVAAEVMKRLARDLDEFAGKKPMKGGR